MKFVLGGNSQVSEGHVVLESEGALSLNNLVNTNVGV